MEINTCLIKYFLPSRIRGVYKFDDNPSKSKITSDEEARSFIDLKLLFLPEEYKKLLEKYIDLEKFTLDRSIGKRILNSTSSNAENKRKYQEYFKCYPHFQPIDDNNYLEAEFVKRVLSPVLSPHGLLKVEPQKQIAQYFADFAIVGEKKYVFEIDGFGKFENRGNLDDFLFRQNEIINLDWQVCRFSYTHIKYNTEKTRKQIFDIFSKDAELKRYLLKDKQSALFEQTQKSFDASEALDPIDLVNNFYLVQDFIADIFSEKNIDSELIIKDNLSYSFSLASLSLSSLYRFLGDIERLFNIDLNLPYIKIIHHDLNNEYQLHPKISITNMELASEIEINSQAISDPNLQARLSVNEKDDFNFRNDLQIEDIKEYLNYYSNSIFRYRDGTYSFQERVFKHIFSGKDVLGISPTGSGKSFCFWLPALLKPGLSIVICPLRSLMRDQKSTLQNYGISSMEFINSDVSPEEQEQIVTDVLLGKIKLLYVAPERIRIKKFLEHLIKIQEFRKINYLIIDEAHCISEWGHDFRPSYLNIPFFFQALKAKNDDLQIISLTATAGGMVRRDIVNILNLKDENVISETDFDRISFSYQIVTVKDHKEKQEKFKQILTKSIPKSLKKKDIYDVVTTSNMRDEKNVGIIYSIYADPHGRYSIYDGISHYLYETKKIIEPEIFFERENDYELTDYGNGRVRAFSSKSPTLCPNCNCYQYISDRSVEEDDYSEIGEDSDLDEIPRGRKRCLYCDHIFVQTNTQDANRPTKYQKATFRNQNEFKSGKFDILVATKGFGMGIDKGSVRFILHTSFASGIESWYQEAGRAGRDNERAHCVILAEIPSDDCIHRLEKIDEAKTPMCNNRGNCSHGRGSLCDYGKQHVFIKRSYPSVEADVASIITTLDKLISSFLEGFGGTIIFKSSNSRLKSDELALFRLKILGIVQEFSVFYKHRLPSFEVTPYTETTPENKIRLKLNTEGMTDRLIEYLKRNSLYEVSEIENPETISSRINKCKEQYDADIIKRIDRRNLQHYDEYKWFYHKIIDYLLVILNHIYKEVVRMRYDMLWNLHYVIWNKDRECRRPVILRFFNTNPKSFEEDYKCELCDVCVGDLHFKRDTRVPPKGTAEAIELQKELNDVLLSGHFDYYRLVRLRDAFRNYPKGIYYRSRGVLEGSPNNLVALYFCREFSPENEKEANTKRLIRTANEFLHMDIVIELYRSSEAEFKRELLFILDDEYGRFNNDDGMKWLYGKAGELLKTGHDEKLNDMNERFGFFFLCNELEATYSKRFGELKQQIEGAYYG